MTIQDVLAQVENLNPNAIDEGIKLSWLDEVEHTIYKEIILTHSGNENLVYEKIALDTDYEKELLAEEPYSKLYVFYLLSKIDFINHEWESYNNTSEMFNNAYKEYAAYYNKNNMPISKIR